MKVSKEQATLNLREAMMKVPIKPLNDSNGILVIARGQNKWALRRRSSDRAFKVYQTKASAVRTARQLVNQGKNDFAVVIEQSGRISKAYISKAYTNAV
jgi:hypothetical protein